MLYVDSKSHAAYALEYHPISALKELTHANDQGQAHNSITHRVSNNSVKENGRKAQ
jgi:hypothetical protein